MTKRIVSLVFSAIAVTGCATELPPPSNLHHGDFLESYFVEFNAHDVEGLRQFWADDIQWMDVSGDTPVAIVSSAGDLSEMMVQYFIDHPDVRSTPRQPVTTADSIAFIETAEWTVQGEVKTQEALAVYQLENGLISKFWYVGDE